MRRARLRSAATALLLGCGQPALADQPLSEVVETGDMDRIATSIEAIWEDAGITLPPGLEWQWGDYLTTYSYFSSREGPAIVSGAVPTAPELETYWQAWSLALTGGVWDPWSYFDTQEAAHDMARMNQFILAVHESAHAVTYRYDPEHEARHDNSISCREYHADRLVAAIIRDLAREDATLERWRADYVALSGVIEATIPAEFRFNPMSFADFERDCAQMAVEQPSPTELRAYASAWFLRHQALLTADLPPMESVFQTHLKDRLSARMDYAPMAAEAISGRLETVSRHPFTPLERYAITPDGGWLSARLWEIADGRITLRLNGQENALVTLTGPVAPPGESGWLQSIAIVADDTAVLALRHGDATLILKSGALTPGESTSFDILARLPEPRRTRIFPGRDPGSIVLARLHEDINWRVQSLDLSTGALGPTTGFNIPRWVQFVGAESPDSLLVVASNALLRFSAGGVERLAGSGLAGVEDGPAADAQLTTLATTLPVADGYLMLEELERDQQALMRKLHLGGQ